MKAKVIYPFFDKRDGSYRNLDEEIEVDEARFKVLSEKKLVKKVSAGKAKANTDAKANADEKEAK